MAVVIATIIVVVTGAVVIVVATMANVAAWVIVVVTGVVVEVASAVVITVLNMSDINMDTAATKVETNCLSLGSPQAAETKTDSDGDNDFLYGMSPLTMGVRRLQFVSDLLLLQRHKRRATTQNPHFQLKVLNS